MLRIPILAAAGAAFVLLALPCCERKDPDLHPSRVVNYLSLDTYVEGLAVTPDGRRLYVACDDPSEGPRTFVLRTQDYATLDTFACGDQVMGMTVLPNGKYLYVGDDPYDAEQLAYVWVVGVADSRVVKKIPAPRWPTSLAATPDSRFLYVGCYWGDTVLVIRTEDNAVVAAIPFSGEVSGLAVTPDGARVYAGGRDLYVIRCSDNVAVDSIALPSWVSGLAMLPDGSRLYAAAGEHCDRIYVINLSDNTVDDSIIVGRPIDEVAALPGGRLVYTSSYSDSTLCVIRTSDDSLVDRIPLEFAPSHLTAHPGGDVVYVLDEDLGRVAVISY